MANTFAPFGFSQYRGLGSAPTYEQSATFCDYNASAMFSGDPVFRNSDGSIYPNTPGTGILAGVFCGCEYSSVSQKRTVWSNYWPGTDVAVGVNVTCYVINDPNAQFKVQVGGSTTIGLALADVGANVQFAYGTGNTSTGLSGAYVDISVTPATTATLPFKVYGLILSPPGAAGTAAGAYNYAIVGFNNIETKTLTGVV